MTRSLRLAACALLISACGNNTISVTAPSVTTTFPFASVVSAYVQSAHDHVLAGTSGPDSYTLTWHSSAGATRPFEGTTASTMDYTNTITKNGAAYAGASLTNYFGLNPFKPLGGANHTQGTYEVAANQQPLPATAVVGQSGPLNTSIKYLDAGKTVTVSTGTASWSLEQDGASTAWACINVVVQYLMVTAPNGVESVCYRIDAAGSLLGVRMTLTLGGIPVVFK